MYYKIYSENNQTHLVERIENSDNARPYIFLKYADAHTILGSSLGIVLRGYSTFLHTFSVKETVYRLKVFFCFFFFFKERWFLFLEITLPIWSQVC